MFIKIRNVCFLLSCFAQASSIFYSSVSSMRGVNISPSVTSSRALVMTLPAMFRA